MTGEYTADSDAEIIVQAERALAAAHLTLDLTMIESLLHPDYVILQPGGQIETKAEVLASYQSGERHWDSASVDELVVRVYGDVARVVGRWRASGKNRGQQFDYQARFISIWLRSEQSWQNIAYQSAELAAN